MYYQALYYLDGYIRKIGSVFKDKDECERVANALVKSTYNWCYDIIETRVVE